jgi:hypothetical protein
MPTITGATLNGVSFRGSAASSAATTEYLAITQNISPFLAVYPFNTDTGFGTRYANAVNHPTTAGTAVAWSPQGNWLAGAFGNNIPRIRAWTFNTSTGLGNRMNASDAGPAHTCDVLAWQPQGNVLIGGQERTPNVIAYNTNTSSTTFPNGLFASIYGNPATRPTNAGRGVTWNPAGNIVAISHNTTPNVSVYPFSVSTGWGTKYSNPATPVTAGSDSGCWHPNGNVLILSSGLTPYLHAYPWSNSTGFGTKYANPGTLPSDAYELAMAPSGNVVFVAQGGSSALAAPYARAYRFDAANSAWGAVYSNPVTSVGMNVFSVSLNTSGTLVALGGQNNTQPFMAYQWNDNTGWGTKYLGPVLTFSTVINVAWRPRLA